MASEPGYPTIVQWVWRVLLRCRFHLLQAHRHDRLVEETIAGLSIAVRPRVFNPALFASSKLLLQVLGPERIGPQSAVLDLGTGSGIAALVAGRWAQRVVAVDINPQAVACARANVNRHRLGHKIDVRQGDLFQPVQGEQFDRVLFNPPFYRGQPEAGLDQAWRSESALERFAEGLPRMLKPGGSALVVFSSNSDEDDLAACLTSHGLLVQTVLKRNIVVEVLTVYEVTPVPAGVGDPNRSA